MSVSISPASPKRASRDAHPGRRLALASLLMVPAFLLAYLPLYLVGEALSSVLDVAEGKLLIEAGLLGWLAWAAMLVLLLVPQGVGAALGRKARNLGDRRLGTIGIAVNATLGGYLFVSVAAQDVLEVLD